MRILSFILMMLSVVSCSSAQDQKSTKGEVKTAKKMVRKPSLRKPLPSVLRSDAECYDFVLGMGKMEARQIDAVLDSAQARQTENEWLESYLDQVLDSARAARFREQSMREKLRLDYFVSEYETLKSCWQINKREMPQAPLTSLSYSMTGMAFNPRMPVSVNRKSDEVALVKFGSWDRERSFETDTTIMRELWEVIRDEQLYRLYLSYRFTSCPLPDFEEVQMLDGIRWHIEAEFADGFSFSSGGDIHPSQNLHAIEEVFSKYINEYLKNNHEPLE